MQHRQCFAVHLRRRALRAAGLAVATVWPVAVLNCAYMLDSAFDVACVRAKRGGKLLAHMLMHGLHGERPVTLLGISVGARLAYHCCLELFRHGACAPLSGALAFFG